MNDRAGDILRSVVMPVIAGLAFLVWFYYFVQSPSSKILIYPFGSVIMVLLYYFSGPVYAGVLLAGLVVIGVSSVFVAGSVVSKMVFPLEALWLWALFLVIDYYRKSRRSQRNRIREETEVLDSRITMLSARIDENGRYGRDLSTRVANYQSLGSMTQALGSLMDEEKMIPLMEELAGKFIGKGAWRVKKGSQNDVFASYVKHTRLPLIVRDLRKDNRFIAVHPRYLSVMAMPLEAGDRYWGILKGTAAGQGVFDESDLRSLSVFAGIASLSLNNARLYRKTQELAITDGLTGLYVQSYFLERLTEEIMRSRSHQLALSIAMIDVDHFKQINDTYGHAMGDVVLRQLAALLRGRLRETDFISRYGGEEFGVIMPQTDIHEAVQVAEEIRATTRDDRFFLPVESFHPVQASVTISVGIASLAGRELSGEDLLRMSDKALYRAKNGGRNRVVHYEER